jgi:hypothetical protein
MTHMSHLHMLMPSDKAPSAERNRIWKQRVWRQYEKIIAHYEFRDAREVREILKFLVENELKEMPDDISQMAILKEVLSDVGDSSHVGHRVKDMRTKLALYYIEQSDDDIIIECPKRAHRLSIRPKSETAATNDTDAQHEGVECYYIGDDIAALMYLIKRLPQLIEFRDVHTRSEYGYNRYTEKSLDAFHKGVRTFLSEDRDNRVELLVGQMAEKNYMEAFTAAVDGQEKKVRCFRLRRSGPLMNFVLLYYSEGTPQKEVLFGWGRYSHSSGESVFRSSHHRLVQEFEKLYESLVKSSDLAPITQLSDFNYEYAEAPIINAAWDQERIYQLFKSARKGAEVRILTTIFLDDRMMYEEFQTLLERGVHIKITLMNHKNAQLVKARFERRKKLDPPKATELIKEQLRSLLEISAEQNFSGSLEVRQSDLMPFAFFVQSEETILMGLLPPLAPYSSGPMIEVKVSSKLGRTLMKNWEAYWKSGVQTSPPPNEAQKRARKRSPNRRG